MTVASAVSRVSYSGNGSTTAFAVPFYFLENAHLRVILRSSAGVETVQTITTNYTVTGAGNPAGGTVNMIVAPASGETLVILRDVPETQETDYTANDPFPAESHERALDKLTMIAQQISEESGRAIKIPETETSNTTVPVSATRANKLLGFSASGDVALSTSTMNQVDAAVSSFVNATGNNAASILYDPDGTGAQQTTVQAKLRETVSVKDFGAVGDGVTDDTAAILAAVTASEAVYFPDGETFRITTEIVVPANRRLFGGGEIFVDQSPYYVRALRLGSNSTVDGLRFRGTGSPMNGDPGLTGGQRGLAVASFGTSNVKVQNCQFRDFVSTGLNTGGSIVDFSNGHAFEVSSCYFDKSNDGFGDIGAGYTSGDVIITKNVSYSNSDIFYGFSSVGSSSTVGSSNVSVTAHHIVTDNIAIKNHWAPAPAGRDLGRHALSGHYDGGLSYLTASNNVFGNVSRHGIYLRGPSTVPSVLCGPNIISNNYLLYCGSGDASNYASGIRAENTLPTTIIGNYFENSGYFPDGTDGTGPGYDIECVRGTTDLIISDNVCINAKNGAISLGTTVGGRTLSNILVSGNTIKNSAFGVFLSPGLASTSVGDIKILDNHIVLTGATHGGSRAAGIATEVDNIATVEKFSLVVRGNTVVGLGKTSNQYGIELQFGGNNFDGTALIADNILRDLEFGLASRRFIVDNPSYIQHRRIGTTVKWVRNRFVSCGDALVIPKTAATVLAVVEDDNIYEDCTAPGIGTTVTWSTAVEGRSIGKDSSGNLLVEFKASAIPTDQQYYEGDRIINTAPAAGGNFGWVCVSSGIPGTWKTFGSIAA